MNDSSDVILQANSISKSFPGVKALDGVDLTLRAGRLTALLGENGAGKSTLMKILAGVQPPDEGELILDGEAVQFSNPREALDRGIAMIYQELSLVPDLTVAENIFLGREPVQLGGAMIDYREMNRRTADWMKLLEMDVSPTTSVGRLRVGQQQLIEIARALAGDVRVLILDEPTSAISEHETEVLFRRIADLKQRGVAMVYITHRLEELERIADDVAIMRDGQLVGSGEYGVRSKSERQGASRRFVAAENRRLAPGRSPVEQRLAEAGTTNKFTHDEMVRLMAGRDVKTSQRSSSATENEVLRVKGISLPHPTRVDDFLVNDVDLHVHRGEVLGIFGLMGAGRTELLECVFGLHHGVASGDVQIEGNDVTIRRPGEAIEHGLALVPEDRKRDGLVLPMTVGENASLASLRRAEKFGLLSSKSLRDHVHPFVERFRVKTPSLRERIVNLSGGNQQKVILAKWLATQPKVLMLDEPTRGIDVQAKNEIYELINELTAEGLAVVMVSSELPEVMAVSDRILVMCEGRATQEFSRDQATDEKILHAALPGRAATI
ncbi:sugar ABC transporter ATP-binding protein [Mariniblastus fucicola]|uniref:Xylose import ATP-binding protein XylG n=1 Tax=Mariniblastus fucicola TaxID=980251 RepID=A0A5B9PF39_9BACT|nr:sugar ABC transporter ATP-binding protein [Mariniblastus fucicola]QEG21601.1 Xylose import ATP-binding protein XylG [Mariniblastus fucicola]